MNGLKTICLNEALRSLVTNRTELGRATCPARGKLSGPAVGTIADTGLLKLKSVILPPAGEQADTAKARPQ